jgi:MSHA pilin protein MshB
MNVTLKSALPRAVHQRKAHQQGFTFLELVIVIVLLGILAATAIPRFLNATDEAEIVALQGVAGGFGTATAMARAQWYAQGKPSTTINGATRSSVDYDGKTIYLNENGWPANTDPLEASRENDQTTAACLQLWQGLLQSAPPITSNRERRIKSQYFVEVIDSNPDICRYELVVNNAPDARPTHYFDYELDDGNITVILPSRK